MSPVEILSGRRLITPIQALYRKLTLITSYNLKHVSDHLVLCLSVLSSLNPTCNPVVLYHNNSICHLLHSEASTIDLQMEVQQGSLEASILNKPTDRSRILVSRFTVYRVFHARKDKFSASLHIYLCIKHSLTYNTY